MPMSTSRSRTMAMSPPLSTRAWVEPADTIASTAASATAPATAAMGPTLADRAAWHILLIRGGSVVLSEYGSKVVRKNGSPAMNRSKT